MTNGNARNGNIRRAARPTSATALAGLAALSLLFAAACSRSKVGYTMQPEVSVNVGAVDPGWPADAKKLSIAEQEVFRMRGRPDLVHVWWLPTGQIVDQMTVRRLRENRKKGSQNLSWIYLERGEEAVFADDFHFRFQPLSDQLRTVCELGDPQEVRRISDPAGKGRLTEKWLYYNHGRFITFIDGVKVSEDKNIQPLPHYLTK